MRGYQLRHECIKTRATKGDNEKPFGEPAALPLGDYQLLDR
jgi:hypothetical protein